jgi:broad specificity phosphatase PhoE
MKNKYTTFYIIRHGETEWNVARRVQGQTDIPLSSEGKQQAMELAGELRHIKFDHVFSSDLFRARETAEIIAIERKMIVNTEKLLRERYFGKYEGMHAEEFFALYTNWEKLTEKQRWEHKLGDEESVAEANIRLMLFLREAALACPGKTILIVCHSGLMRGLLIKLAYKTFDTVKGFSNCGYIKLESDGIDFFVNGVSGLVE